MNHHFANAGDVMKHLSLMQVVDLVRPTRYLESHSGAFDYPLAEREGPLPDGVWDFAVRAPAVRALGESAYLGLLQKIAGSPSAPGTYPGSLRCVWELLGASAAYVVSDIDTEALASVGVAFESRGAQPILSSTDGVDVVLDEARPGDLVLIDPFDPDAKSPEHGLSAVEAFDVLVARGAVVLLWRALQSAPEDAPSVGAADLAVSLLFAGRTGSMEGCELILGNLGPDVAAEVAKLAAAHGGILGNGRMRIDAAHRPGKAGRAKVVPSAPKRTTQATDCLFDRYVMVDWSATSTPSRVEPTKDAIWVGDLSPDGQQETYCRTRDIATEVARAILRDAVENNQRVLIGFDFPFGYPQGFAAAARFDLRHPWKAVWRDLAERITDDAKNSNNRFDVARVYNQRTGSGPGPFWGCPAGQDFGGLTRTKQGLVSFPYAVAGGEIAAFRATESLIPGTVQETWKLWGNGSVGSQALVGINRVARLRFSREFDPISQVWPFETGLEAPVLPEGSAAIVFAEIWPGIVDAQEVSGLMGLGLIRDQAQVRLMCEWAKSHDQSGDLGQYLAPPQAIAGNRVVVLTEEGWILGCL